MESGFRTYSAFEKWQIATNWKQIYTMTDDVNFHTYMSLKTDNEISLFDGHNLKIVSTVHKQSLHQVH